MWVTLSNTDSEHSSLQFEEIHSTLRSSNSWQSEGTPLSPILYYFRLTCNPNSADSQGNLIFHQMLTLSQFLLTSGHRPPIKLDIKILPDWTRHTQKDDKILAFSSAVEVRSPVNFTILIQLYQMTIST